MTEHKNKWSNTPLHSAISGKGHLGILQFFISDQNCDPYIPGQCRGTLLHCAAQFGYLHIVKYLTNEQEFNPSCLDENIVKYLTDKQACNSLHFDNLKYTPFHFAAMNGHIEIVKFFH